jgi:hypothetical protein
MNPTLVLDILEKVLEKYFFPNHFQSKEFQTDNKFKEFAIDFGRYSFTNQQVDHPDFRQLKNYLVICEPFDTLGSTLKISVTSVGVTKEGIFIYNHVSFTDFTKVASIIKDPYMRGAKNLDKEIESQGFQIFPINKLLLPISYHHKVMELVKDA